MEHLGDDDLLELTVGQPDAFAVFYRRHERTPLGFFMRRTGDPELAADLCAEAFAAALLAAGRFDRRRAPARAWLFGIAQNKLLKAWERGRAEDTARRRMRMPPVALEDEQLERIVQLSGDARVDDLLRQLPAAQARVVRARVIDEETYEQIARQAQCSESVVRQRVSRGLASLRAIVKEEP